jgi:hypothetical protein
MGAPLGNRNRLKHGDQSKAMKALYRLMAQWRRETQALLARAVCELVSRGSSPVYGGGGPPKAGEGAPPPSRAVALATSPASQGRKIHRSTAGQSCIV